MTMGVSIIGLLLTVAILMLILVSCPEIGTLGTVLIWIS